MNFLARWKALVAIAAFVLVTAAAGMLAGLGQAGGTREHAPKPYLRHPEYARKALLLAKAAGIKVSPALRAAAREQAAHPRMLWRGASARFSVLLGTAATPSQLPPEVRRFVTYAASTTHLSRDTALARVKVLRSTMGSARSALYALQEVAARRASSSPITAARAGPPDRLSPPGSSAAAGRTATPTYSSASVEGRIPCSGA